MMMMMMMMMTIITKRTKNQVTMKVVYQVQPIPMHPMDRIRNPVHPMMNIMPHEKFQRKKSIDMAKAR